MAMKTLWKYLNPTKGRKNILLFTFTITVLIVGFFFLIRSPQLVADLQSNEFGPILDIVILTIAFTILIVVTFGSLVSGYGLGDLLGRVFEAGLAAMVFMQRLSAQLLHVMVVVVGYLRYLFSQILAPIVAIHTPTKRLPVYPPVKLSPFAALPYELYPTSCILLN
ncbi:MAG: hypothetical protein KDI79_08480 [Anaerolineae bacterium]|nr:hypothetical protein [Anaerolineae bacterium]